jgi:Tfp pilus assembly protein PilF
MHALSSVICGMLFFHCVATAMPAQISERMMLSPSSVGWGLGKQGGVGVSERIALRRGVAVSALRGGRRKESGADKKERVQTSDEFVSSSESEGGENRVAERQQMLMAAVEESPHDAYALGELGDFMWEQMGDLDAAEEAFRRAVTSNPYDVGALTDLGTFLAEERKNLVEAERVFRRAVESSPSDADALCCLADFFTHHLSDLQSAADYYNKAVLHNPSDTDALCEFATFLVEQAKNTSAAEELFLQEGQILEDFVSALARPTGLTVSSCSQAVSCRPHSVETLRSYAEFLCEQKKDVSGAGEYFRRAVESNPHNPDALCALAVWCSNTFVY